MPETIKTEADAEKYVREHVAFKAAEDSRRLTLPQKPEDYKLQLPKDFKAPQGIEFVPNENDPLLPLAREFAKEAGLSQEQFEKLVGFKAAIEIGNRQQMDAARADQLQKLGVNGTARKTALDTWLNATLGPELGKHMSEFTFTAQQVEGFEKIMANARNQGVGNPPNGHRDPEAPGKVSQADYDRMSFSERADYAKRFPQPQLNGH